MDFAYLVKHMATFLMNNIYPLAMQNIYDALRKGDFSFNDTEW